MADNLAINFANRFNPQFDMLAQSMLPKMEPSVLQDADGGEKSFRDQIGEMDGEEVADLNADTPIQSENTDRRAIMSTPWKWNRLVRRSEVIRMMKNPQDDYARAAVAGRNRHVNKKITAAAVGTAFRGKDGTTPVTLPGTQQITNTGSTGLTLAKIRKAHEILGNNAVLDIEMGDLYFTASYTQQNDLLATTEATSSDFAAVKALVNGEIDFFMGFRWIWLQSELIGTDGNGDRQCFAHARSGLILRKPEDMFRRITERADKNYNVQVHLAGDYGAARLEEKKVVEVPCTEPA